jgi:hypothetical protein
VCDTSAELAAEISDSNGWPELLPFIFQLVQSQDAQVHCLDPNSWILVEMRIALNHWI